MLTGEGQSGYQGGRDMTWGGAAAGQHERASKVGASNRAQGRGGSVQLYPQGAGAAARAPGGWLLQEMCCREHPGRCEGKSVGRE